MTGSVFTAALDVVLLSPVWLAEGNTRGLDGGLSIGVPLKSAKHKNKAVVYFSSNATWLQVAIPNMES